MTWSLGPFEVPQGQAICTTLRRALFPLVTRCSVLSADKGIQRLATKPENKRYSCQYKRVYHHYFKVNTGKCLTNCQVWQTPTGAAKAKALGTPAARPAQGGGQTARGPGTRHRPCSPGGFGGCGSTDHKQRQGPSAREAATALLPPAARVSSARGKRPRRPRRVPRPRVHAAPRPPPEFREKRPGKTNAFPTGRRGSRDTRHPKHRRRDGA